MRNEVNYKSKYMAIRAKYMNDVDMAFRLGFEQGQQQAEQEQMMQQQAEQQAMEQAQAAAMSGGAPGQDGQPPQEGQPQEANGNPNEDASNGNADPNAAMAGQPSELDQHISQLEQMIAKSEKLANDPEIKKSLDKLIAIRKSELQAIQFKQGAQAIKGIAKALHKPAFKMSVQANHNLTNNAKTAVSLQHKIVNDMMAKMVDEEKRASNDIKNILSIEGLTKGE